VNSYLGKEIRRLREGFPQKLKIVAPKCIREGGADLEKKLKRDRTDPNRKKVGQERR